MEAINFGAPRGKPHDLADAWVAQTENGLTLSGCACGESSIILLARPERALPVTIFTVFANALRSLHA